MIDTSLDFTKTLVAGSLSLGIAELQGKLVLVGSDGEFSIRIDPLSVTQPAHVRLGTFDMDIETFTIESNGTFDVEFLVRQFGPDALSIRDLTLAMSKTGTSLTTFSASLTGGKLFLPMGDPITLPELEFDFDSRIDHTFTIPALKLGPFFSTTSAQFRLQQLSSGLIRFESLNAPSVSLLGDTVGLTLDDLLVESDGTFSGQVSGQLSLFGRALGSATFQIANIGGVVRLRIPSSSPVSYNLLFANANFHGDVFSDGRFSLTGSLSVDIDILIASLSGSVSITVANTGISGEFDGTACVFPFPCVSASGTMSSTGYVESTVKVDTNGNGKKDTFYDVDFQIGAGPSGGADTTKPSMATPGNRTVDADIPTGRSKARVYYATPTATDQGATVPVVCTPPSGSDFSVGVTTVTCRASDRAGNTRTVTFTVTVTDTSPNFSAIAQAAAGGSITQAGGGFAGNAAVMATMFSDPVVLGTAIADRDGNVSFELTIPADAGRRTHDRAERRGPRRRPGDREPHDRGDRSRLRPGSPSGEPGTATPGTATPGTAHPRYRDPRYRDPSAPRPPVRGRPRVGRPRVGRPRVGRRRVGRPPVGPPTVPGTSVHRRRPSRPPRCRARARRCRVRARRCRSRWRCTSSTCPRPVCSTHATTRWSPAARSVRCRWPGVPVCRPTPRRWW
ncbi:MAG: HYR domain-containing protein [Ilumatobacteraceae bacterium]